MKIRDKKSFIIGVLLLCVIPLLAISPLEGHAALMVLPLAFAAKYLHAGLSVSGSAQKKQTDDAYHRAARELLGEHATRKIWLPLILLGIFLIVSNTLIEVFDYFPSAGAVLAVFIVSAIVILYSVGLEIKVLKRVADEENSRTKNEKRG